jgi:uncharacterized protein YdhG (YjbR/CyaY superfamily)
MESSRSVPSSIDEYIQGFEPDVQAILQQVRQVVREAAPHAREVISYRMPAFKQNGVLVYFAAFKNTLVSIHPSLEMLACRKLRHLTQERKGTFAFPWMSRSHTISSLV